MKIKPSFGMVDRQKTIGFEHGIEPVMGVSRAFQNRKSLVYCIFCLLVSSHAFAGPPIIEIEIREHLFYPSDVEVPKDTKVKLLIKNMDSSPEEFESYDLNREKVISGKSKAVVFIGPLPAGEYHFFGEFHPKSAQGRVVVK